MKTQDTLSPHILIANEIKDKIHAHAIPAVAQVYDYRFNYENAQLETEYSITALARDQMLSIAAISRTPATSAIPSKSEYIVEIFNPDAVLQSAHQFNTEIITGTEAQYVFEQIEDCYYLNAIKNTCGQNNDYQVAQYIRQNIENGKLHIMRTPTTKRMVPSPYINTDEIEIYTRDYRAKDISTGATVSAQALVRPYNAMSKDNYHAYAGNLDKLSAEMAASYEQTGTAFAGYIYRILARNYGRR